MQQRPSCPVVCLGRQWRLHMKFTLPGMLITALIVASPAALAQSNMGYSGTSSNPATSVSKDETTGMTTNRTKKHMTSHKQKKHTAGYKQRHHANATSPKASTTGTVINTAKPEMKDTTPKTHPILDKRKQRPSDIAARSPLSAEKCEQFEAIENQLTQRLPIATIIINSTAMTDTITSNEPSPSIGRKS